MAAEPKVYETTFLLTCHRSGRILLWTRHRRMHGRRQIRNSTRHAGFDGAEDAGRDGAFARLRYRAAHRANQRRGAANQSRDDLRFAGALDAQGLDFGIVGNVGEQPKSQILYDQQKREETAAYRSAKLG